jgi:nucleoside 2-deoxyribosyltransferase
MSQPKIFISYAHQDVEWVRQFANRLADHRINVWLDSQSVVPGERFDQAIESGLRNSDVLVAVLAENYQASPNVLFELGAALGMHKPVIPIVDQDRDISNIPFNIRSRRYLVRKSPGETARQVAEALQPLESVGEKAELLSASK